jgi:hypothetical protein
MSMLMPSRSCSASVYSQPSESPFAPADQATLFARAPEDGWEVVINQLIDFGRLQDDWDGAGSVAPDSGLVAGAIKLARALRAEKKPAVGRVTASVNGTVYFEWHTAEGYQEIEVTSPVDAELRWVAKGSKVAEVTRLEIR